MKRLLRVLLIVSYIDSRFTSHYSAFTTMPVPLLSDAQPPGGFRVSDAGRGLLVLLIALTRWLGLVSAQPLPVPERITGQQGLPQAFIPSIVQDKTGFIWAATRDGLCRYDGQQFKVFQPNPTGKPSLSFAAIAELKLDRQGRLWIRSETNDIDVFDPTTETFTNLTRRGALRAALANVPISRFYVDRLANVWLILDRTELLRVDGQTNRLYRYRTKLLRAFQTRNLAIMDVIQDGQGTVWVSTLSGLARLEPSTQTFVQIRPPSGQPNSLPDHRLGNLFVRSTGELMMCSPTHLTLYNPQSGRFRNYPLARPGNEWWYVNYDADSKGTVYFDKENELVRFTDQQGPVVVEQQAKGIEELASLMIDRSDVLWIGTNGAGIRKYDLRPNPFQTQPYKTSFHNDLLSPRWLGIPALPFPSASQAVDSYLFRYTLDARQKLWCSVGTSNVYCIDLVHKKTKKISFPIPVLADRSTRKPLSLATDPAGHVWAVHDSLLWRFDAQKSAWLSLPVHLPRPLASEQLALVADERAWWLITKNSGLWRLERTTGRLTQFAHQPGNPYSLSSNALYCISQDPTNANRLWIGTLGSGVCAFDKQSGRCRRFTTKEGLPNNVIYSALPDKRGFLWMGTNKGLCRLNRQTYETRNFTQQDGLLADEFNRFHWLLLPGPAQPPAAPRTKRGRTGWADDRILMGGLEGITAFYPDQVGTDPFKPRIELTDLQVNGQSVEPGPDSPLGNRPIQAADQLVLPHTKNFITVSFAVFQFNRRSLNRFRYWLEGINPDWVESNRPEAIYTALPPGTYTLRLNGANTAGVWSPHVRTLRITIRPPFWATGWAYLVYTLAIGSIAYGLIRLSVNRMKLHQSVAFQQQEVALKQRETEQLRANDQMKSRFFANITHEFRTPLTLILAPAEQMMAETLQPRNRRRLRTIEQNAHQLLRLINQLLDLSKLEASVMPVHEWRGTLSECIERWLQPLMEQATAQDLQLTFTSTVVDSYWFDVEKLERIVYNLVTNALKFTEQGQIAVSLTPDRNDSAGPVVLTVADTGRGIPPASLPHIFDRFYRVEPNGAETSQPGTGIGLALVKELVTLQGGQITVESQVGEGTTFVVTLPYRSAAPAPTAPTSPPPTDESNSLVDASATPSVLVVEDNDELAHFITESLPGAYRIDRAVNGRDGWEKALEYGPDLIISDVMMPDPDRPDPDEPEMDGFRLLGKLKEDLRTSHIPVMLLTAKASVENRMEGLSRGADDYLTKPFQVAELQLRVRNRLAGKQRLREWVRTTLVSPDDRPTLPAPEAPDPFLTRLYELMDAHLADTSFGLEALMQELGLSRTNLFRKVKALTGLAAGDLLRQYRLKRATQYLREGLPVSETAYRVGFDSPAYFAKCFREAYQLTPREFAAQP